MVFIFHVGDRRATTILVKQRSPNPFFVNCFIAFPYVQCFGNQLPPSSLWNTDNFMSLLVTRIISHVLFKKEFPNLLKDERYTCNFNLIIQVPKFWLHTTPFLSPKVLYPRNSSLLNPSRIVTLIWNNQTQPSEDKKDTSLWRYG